MMPLCHLTDDDLGRILALAAHVKSYKDDRRTISEPCAIRDGLVMASDLAEARIPTRAESNGPHWVEMLSLVESLTPAARVELTALMWLGRERHGTLRQFLAEAKTREDDPYRAIYICLKPLWRYLPEGLRRASLSPPKYGN